MTRSKHRPLPLRVLRDFAWCLDEATKAAYLAMEQKRRENAKPVLAKTIQPVETTPTVEADAARLVPESVEP